jgi:hypothetical protein
VKQSSLKYSVGFGQPMQPQDGFAYQPGMQSHFFKKSIIDVQAMQIAICNTRAFFLPFFSHAFVCLSPVFLPSFLLAYFPYQFSMTLLPLYIEGIF